MCMSNVCVYDVLQRVVEYAVYMQFQRIERAHVNVMMLSYTWCWQMCPFHRIINNLALLFQRPPFVTQIRVTHTRHFSPRYYDAAPSFLSREDFTTAQHYTHTARRYLPLPAIFCVFFTTLLSSSTRRRFYPQRSSGQAVVTGVVPAPPRVRAFIFIARRVQHSPCSSIFIECC